MLTDRFIRNAPPGKHTDEEGLFLNVSPTGRKTFVLRLQHGGTDRQKTLGVYPTMSLAEARVLAQELRRDRTAPSATVLEVTEAFMDYIRREYADPDQVERGLHRDIIPTFGRREIRTITRLEFARMLQDIVDRGAPVAANRTLAWGKQLWNFALQRGWVDDNPLHPLTRRMVGGRERPRERTLSWDEIADFFRLLRDESHRTSPGTRWALYLCLLTGQRASEVLSFQITDQPYLTGRAKRTHAGEMKYKVPLTPHVRAAVAAFSNTDIPNDARVLSHALRRVGATYTPHDLRRTMATRMADLGIAPHIVEKLLNHKMEGMLAVYNHAEYWPERVAALRLWGNKLAAIRRRVS